MGGSGSGTAKKLQTHFRVNYRNVPCSLGTRLNWTETDMNRNQN